MNWNDIYEELTDEMKRNDVAAKSLAANTPDDRLQQIEELFEVEVLEREMMDKICLQYARTKTWPINMTRAQTILAHIRLGHAQQFACFLCRWRSEIFENQFQDSQKSKILECLLLDYWRFAGNSRWRRTA
jgi:hypothetical protein